jgi:hypothetical protein
VGSKWVDPRCTTNTIFRTFIIGYNNVRSN